MCVNSAVGEQWEMKNPYNYVSEVIVVKLNYFHFYKLALPKTHCLMHLTLGE
jgi:hypothetical protein